jgi:regulator of sigma E protease
MLNLIGQLLAYTVPFLLVLTLIVTIHELGHFGVARLFKVKIDRFSIGFGKALLSRVDRHGVEWRLAWLPLGGYVKFAGDLDPSSVPDARGLDILRREIIDEHGAGAERDYFHFKPVWQRALIVAAGPVANFLLAISLFAFLFSVVGVQVAPPRIATVAPGSPAATAGFLPNDLIVAIDGRAMTDQSDVARRVALSSNTQLRITIERDGQRQDLLATPERVEQADEIAGTIRMGMLGVGMAAAPGDVRHIRYAPHEAIGQGAAQTWSVLTTTTHYLGRILTGKESGDQLSGPIGIAKASGGITQSAASVQADAGLRAANVAVQLLSFAAILSIGIGFLNLLPIPVLDGGHLLFYAYEAVARQPLGARVQEVGYRIGLVLLVGLMLFATWNDLQKLSLFKFLGGLAS